MTEISPRSVFREDHEQFRDQVRRFLEREVVPYHESWEEQGFVPREVWLKAGQAGFLAVTVSEEYGGAGGDFGHSAVIIEEIARVNATALGFTTHSEIVAQYIVAYGSEEQRRRWLPGMVSGEIIGVIAMTEPGSGSDLRSIKTSIRRDGDEFIVSGAKTFISNGDSADLAVVVGKADPAARELTLICVESDRSGFSKGKRLKKIGLKGQDTTELFFDSVRVPSQNLLGEEDRGFHYLTHQLAWERLIIAIRAAASIEAMLAETIAYCRDRTVFGQSLLDYQNTRFSLAQADAEVTMLRAFVDQCLMEMMAGKLSAVTAAKAKLLGSEMQGRLLDSFLQLHGGYGFMSEYRIARAWVDARVARIYGGTSEIMKEIIGRNL